MADPTGETLPTGSTPPAGEATPPATPPSNPPAGEATPPAGEVTPPAGEATPPAGEGKPDWATLRTAYAKGDEKLEKRLSRYSSAEAALDALIAAQNKIAGGTLKSTLPEKATPEELAAWREENGIPPEASGYDVSDVTVAPEAKEVMDGFLAKMHEVNAPPAVVKAALAFNAERRAEQEEARRQMDLEAKEAAEEVLAQEWGSEGKLNRSLIIGLLDTAPEGVKDKILGGRLEDGTPIASDAATLRWLANLAREVNPTATVVPGSGTNAAAAMESEMASLQKLMGDHSSEYWKGPNADKMQARYRQLLDVQSKLKR